MSVTALDSRRQRLGGSTIAAACGVDPFTSPIRLWLEMTGRVECETSEWMEWGNRLQPAIIEAVRDEGHAVLDVSPRPASDGQRPWLVGHPDAYLGGDRPLGILEAKAVGQWAHRAHGSAPIHYQAQVQTYLHLTGLGHGLLAALVGGQRLELVEIERRQSEIDLLLELADGFMEYVRADEQPPASGHPDDRAALAEAFPTVTRGKVVRETREVRDARRELHGLLEAEKARKARIEHLRATITEAMGDADTLISAHDETVARWSSVNSTRFDGKAHAAQNPACHERFMAVTPSRRFSLV